MWTEKQWNEIGLVNLPPEEFERAFHDAHGAIVGVINSSEMYVSDAIAALSYLAGTLQEEIAELELVELKSKS